MKILIIGSKGFIGQHCFSYFKNEQKEVWGADVVTDYTSSNYFLIDPSSNDFSKLFQEVDFDVCINCSGAASVPDSLNNPKRDFYLNTLNVFNLLNAIKEHATNCKFINLSSAAVYGSPEVLPIPESQTLKPVSPYGIHKKMAEDLCQEFNQFFNVQSCSLRIFSAYGPGLKKQLFWDIFQKSSKSDSLKLFGTGNESRDFIFVDDIVMAIATIMNRAECFNGDKINLASGQEYTISDVVKIFLKELNWDGELTFSGEQRKGDPLNWKADISRLQELGFKSKVTVNQGLAAYSKWIQKL